jgi:hypothetical protein
MRNKVFAVYRGDTFIDLGTLRELSNRLGIKSTSIKYYTTAAYKRKVEKRIKGRYENQMIIIEIPEGEDD